jgi:hypothetical protein
VEKEEEEEKLDRQELRDDLGPGISTWEAPEDE